LHIHPDDRFSISPAPDGGADADVEMNDPTGSVDGAETDGEARYEADIETEDEILYDAPEELETPAHNPESDDPDAAFLTSADDADPHQEDSSPNSDRLSGLEPNTDTETMPDDPLPGGDDKNGDFSPEEEPAEESDELASPSTFVKTLKSSPHSKSQPTPRTGFIDLTGMSSDSSTTRKKMKAAERAAAYGGQPRDATAAMVDAWDMPTLANKSDRERILIKLLRNVGERNRQRLYTCYNSNRADFATHLFAACQFAKESGTAGAGLIEDDVEAISLAGSICVSWLFPAKSADDIRNMSDAAFNKAVDAKELQLFTSMFAGFLMQRNGSLFNAPTQTPSKKKNNSSDPIEISSDDVLQSHERNRSTRKRLVQRSELARKSRSKALQREQKLAESQTANSSQLAAMISSETSNSAVEINPARDDVDGPVYVCDRIARKMKAHQVDGVQFLWREITADDEDGAQGCVLAHTMGLGKTMQTIALLVAVNEAARSKKRSVYRQIPCHLRPDGIQDRMLRVLILCPPALIENWHREIKQWAPKMLGHVFSIDSGSKATHLRHLEDWMRLGGLVLLGYQRFRMMVLQKSHAKQKAPMSEQQLARLKDILISGTEIIVADEAHNLKNNKSEIGKAAAQIETHSRIGLTGTPMSNDVDEIYAVISWAAPGYLGDPTEFRAYYTEPIKDGLYPDSTAAEKRKSIMKLKVLHSDIQPKVNRANIEVLRGSLRPKVEFVITVALGEDQTELYKRYIKAILSNDRNSEADRMTIFSWLAVLQLLTNHPRCFRLKLLAPPAPPKKMSAKTAQQDDDFDDDVPGDRTPATMESGSVTPASEYMVTTTEQLIDAEVTKEAPADAPLHKLGLDETMIKHILHGFEEDVDPQLSAKVTIFLTLLKYSNECGDKVLVFSSSIPTLEYLDELLTQQDMLFGRIDGQTNMQKRMQALEDFHNDDFDIMLVSTKAGGVGLNIQGANRVFIFDFGFNPAWEEQAIGRAYRLGQTKPVYVYRFVAGGTFENEIYNKQLFKMSLAQRVVDKKKPQRHAKRDTREYLYVPKPVKQENLNEEAGKDPKVLDRLLSQHGQEEDGKFDTMIRAIKTMETLQEEALDEQLDEEGQREVELEIQQGRMRTKSKRAPGATQFPRPGSSLTVKLPMPTQPNPQYHTAAPALAPPPSTIAGPSNYPGPAGHPLGGLPRMQLP
jgi:SNF2 family DNA or RNA helicase